MDPVRPTSTPSAVAAPADSEAAMLNHQARANVSARAGYFRWVICALLLLGTTKNYMDRWVISALKTTLQHDLGWNEINYSDLVFAFQAAYAVGMLVVGRLIDRLGTRLGYAIVMVFWSLASMAHALGSSLSSFLMARLALGYGDIQRGDECGGDSSRAVRAVDHTPTWLAVDLCHYRLARLCLARIVALALSDTAGPPTLLQS